MSGDGPDIQLTSDSGRPALMYLSSVLVHSLCSSYRHLWLPLWSKANIIASHLAGPGSIPGPSVFLLEVFREVFLNFKSNVGKNLGPIHPRISLAIIIIKIIHLSLQTRMTSDVYAI